MLTKFSVNKRMSTKFFSPQEELATVFKNFFGREKQVAEIEDKWSFKISDNILLFKE